MCPGGENTPEIGLITQICLKAPAQFNGLHSLKIEAITGMISAAPSHILSTITHAALTVKILRL